MTAPALASRPPGRAVLRIAAALTQLLCAGCLLLGTIAFVLLQQNRMAGSGGVILWAAAALIGLVFGGLMGRGGLISLMICGLLDAALGIVLLAIEYETLRSLLRVLPTSDVEMIADVVTAIGASLLGAFALCALAIPQALRYTRWMHEETEPRLASSTARGFPPPPVSAARNSVWQLPIVAPDETRSRRRMYFMLAGFAIGFGGGIGVLVSSTTSSGGGAAVAPAAGSVAGAETPDPQRAGSGGDGSGGSAGGAGGATAEPGSSAFAAAIAKIGAGEGTDADSAGNARPAADPTLPPSTGAGAGGTGAGEPASAAALIEAQRAALAKGDLAALSRMLAPGAFGFGVDAGEVAEGRDAALQLLREDLGDLVQRGADVDVRYSNVGEARDHAWIALELDIAAAGQPARRFAVTELAARTGGSGSGSGPGSGSGSGSVDAGPWRVVAWHWATPVADKAADRMALLGTKPTPKAIASVLTGPKALEDAVRTAFGSRRAFAAARSEHERAFNFGSGPSERILGGEAIKRVFSRIKADLRLHDGVRIVASSAWDPAHKDAPALAFAAANVDFTTKTRAATELTHTFRVLAVLLLEDGAWKVVQTQWSHGGPVR